MEDVVVGVSLSIDYDDVDDNEVMLPVCCSGRR
jgi:hypothetical protein